MKTEHFFMKIINKKQIIIPLILIFIIPAIFYIYTIPSVRSAWVLATTVQPETFTELYFEDHINLPKAAIKEKVNDFKFTIHNLEYKTMKYPYTIYAEADGIRQELDKGSVTLRQDEYKTILESFSLVIEGKRTKVTVLLTDKNQSIHFWMGENQ